MRWRGNMRRTRRGKNWNGRHTTPIENGTYGLHCENGNRPNVSLPGERTSARQALQALVKELNANRLGRKVEDETGHRRNARVREDTDERTR